MRRLYYNIAAGKTVNLIHFILSISFVLFLSIIMSYVGISNISRTNYNLKEKVNLKKNNENEQKKIAENEELFENKIRDIKSKWNNRVRFANGVIKAKEFSFLERLGFFERILPDGIRINEISLDFRAKGDILLTVNTYSSDKLYELYKRLIGYNLVIVGESENNGVFRSKLKITYKNEKR